VTHPRGPHPAAARDAARHGVAVSIILSVLILMTALFIQAPLEFSALSDRAADRDHAAASLNLASTRLILAHGHEGTAAAGHVIEASAIS